MLNVQEQMERVKPYEDQGLDFMKRCNVRYALGLAKVELRRGTKEEDTKKNADFIATTLEGEECKIACRTSFAQLPKNTKEENKDKNVPKNYQTITIRGYINSSYSGYDKTSGIFIGNKTELQKIVEGEGDLMLTIYVNKGKIVRYVLVCLNALRTSGLLDKEIIDKNEEVHFGKNGDDENQFLIIELDVLEKYGCIIADEVTAYYSKDLWYPLQGMGSFDDIEQGVK